MFWMNYFLLWSSFYGGLFQDVLAIVILKYLVFDQPWWLTFLLQYFPLLSNIFQYYCYVVRASFHFETLFSTRPIKLVVEEINRNKSVALTPITFFIHQKEKHMSIRHNSILTLMKSGVSFFHIGVMYMIYLDVKYFSVVCLSIYYEKLAVKTTLTAMGHFFVKKLNYCPSDIICNSIPLKCQCLKHT